MITVEGKGNVRATIIADSINAYGNRITTYELEHHRWILAELNTHRILSKNGASSRAIPLKTQIANVERWGVEPLYWGQNQAGMVAKGVEISDIDRAREVWNEARASAIRAATALEELGLHKQWGGRLLEPYAIQKTVVTSTEWQNFYELRDHPDAQPEFAELARCMATAHDASTPTVLMPGSWHVPYYKDGYWIPTDWVNDDGETVDAGDVKLLIDSNEEPDPVKRLAKQIEHGNTCFTLKEALAISISASAQVSYRKSDFSLEKAKEIIERLFPKDSPWHMSPFEHQATPIVYDHTTGKIPTGVTHLSTRNKSGSKLWSGNFCGWVQLRQIIEIDPSSAYSMFGISHE